MKGLYFSDNSSTWIEYPGMVWLKLLPACTDDVTGTIRVGSVKVLVEASPRPVSDISLAVWPTEAVPFSCISTCCGLEVAFTSLRKTLCCAASRVTE